LLQGLLSDSFLEREIVLENPQLIHSDATFYDEVVKQLSLQDYKDIVESLKGDGDDLDATLAQRSLATAFLKYLRLRLEEEKMIRVTLYDAIYGTPLMQGLLEESDLKGLEPLTDSLVIPE
jgi:hypothetical protein